MRLLAELQRRNVIRMAGLYLVGAWLVVQVAGTLLPMFCAPEWIARKVVVLLADNGSHPAGLNQEKSPNPSTIRYYPVPLHGNMP